jgi:hypothetical protein
MLPHASVNGNIVRWRGYVPLSIWSTASSTRLYSRTKSHDAPVFGAFRRGVEAVLAGIAVALRRAHAGGAAMLAAAQLVLHRWRAAEAAGAREGSAPPAGEHAGDRLRIRLCALRARG